MSKFFLLDKVILTRTSLLIKERILRKKVFNLVRMLFVSSGDILVVTFWKEALIYRFEGICIAIRKKKLTNPNTTIVLRNILMRVGIEFTISYYFNRIYFLTTSDYKRKQFFYNRCKLYYLRTRVNRASRVRK